MREASQASAPDLSESARAVSRFYQSLSSAPWIKDLYSSLKPSPSRPLSQERSEETDGKFALLKLDEHLDFLKRVLNGVEMPEGAARLFLERFEKIKDAAIADPSLYLIFVGETSSGKAALINALLGEEILDASAPYTAPLETRILHHTDLYAEVEFHEGTPVRQYARHYTTDEIILNMFFPHAAAAKKQHPSGLDEQGRERVRAFLRKYRGGDLGLEKVKRVSLFHPFKKLQDQLTLIDTPTIQGDHPECAGIVREAIKRVGAVVILAIQAETSPTPTMVDFLRGVKGQLQNCIWTLSGMDRAEGGEWKKRVKAVRDLLQKELELGELEVYPFAGSAVINLPSGGAAIAGDSVPSDPSDHFERMVHHRLQVQKRLRTVESLSKMMEGLLKELDAHLEKKAKLIVEEYEASGQRIVPDLPTFSKEQYRECRGAVDATASEIDQGLKSAVDLHSKRVKGAVQSEIESASDPDQLRNIITMGVEKHLQKGISLIEQDVNERLKKQARAVSKAAETFEECFYQQYREIDEILYTDSPDRLEYRPATVQLEGETVFSSGVDLMEEKEKQGRAGKMVDFMRRKMDERKTEAWKKIEAELDAHTEKMYATLLKEFAKERKRAHRTLKDHLMTYVEKYGEIVRNFRESQLRDREPLNPLVDVIKNYRVEVKGKRKGLVRIGQAEKAPGSK